MGVEVRVGVRVGRWVGVRVGVSGWGVCRWARVWVGGWE